MTWRALFTSPYVLVNRLIGERADLESRFADMYSSTWSEQNSNLLCDYTMDLATGELVASEPVRAGR
jgi:hypothetical protein